MNAIFSPKAQLVLGWILFVGSFICWPLSQLTVAASEPPFTLGLSWFAVVLNGLGIIVTAQVNKDVSVQADTANVEANEVHIQEES